MIESATLWAILTSPRSGQQVELPPFHEIHMIARSVGGLHEHVVYQNDMDGDARQWWITVEDICRTTTSEKRARRWLIHFIGRELTPSGRKLAYDLPGAFT